MVSDSSLFPNGVSESLDPQLLLTPLTSFTGAYLDLGDVLMSQGVGIEIQTAHTHFLQGGVPSNDISGTWSVLASVPEPATAVQAGIASAIGLALAAFRKRKEARRQRPVGPLDAKQ